MSEWPGYLSGLSASRLEVPYSVIFSSKSAGDALCWRKSRNYFCRKLQIHPFDNYVIWPGSLALMNREPITLRNLLMRARLQDQKECVT
jgi:hypothetical protein